MASKLPAKIMELAAMINTPPIHTYLFIEVKQSLQEAIRTKKTNALAHLRVRLEPAVLVNAEVSPKRYVYRVTLDVFRAFGYTVNLSPGLYVIEVTIVALFGTDSLKAENNMEREPLT